jgi:fibronectin type 3 domain-containing protein
VYRSTQSGTGYTIVNTSVVTGVTFTDTSVTAGQTYYYVLTSVNSSGVNSAYSTQVTAAVPAS